MTAMDREIHRAPDAPLETAELSPASVPRLIARLLSRTGSHASRSSLPKDWKISIQQDQTSSHILCSDGELSIVEGRSSQVESWRVLEPIDCPARFLRSNVPIREARRAAPFLLEPQIGLGLEECLTAFAFLSQDNQAWECLAAYCRRDVIDAAADVRGIFPGTLAAATLPALLQSPCCLVAPEDVDGLWAVTFSQSWLIVLVSGGKAIATRSTPRGDLLRLQMVQLELGPLLSRRSLGDGGPLGWNPIELRGVPTGQEWLAACAACLATRSPSLDLCPPSLNRCLDRKQSRRTMWLAAILVTMICAFASYAFQIAVNDRVEGCGISLAEIPQELSRLAHETSESSAPFRPEPHLPTCSQVLSWLASVPGLEQSPDCQIEKFRYQILQYPTANKEREPYTGRVQLEISCKDSFLARRILDFISVADPISPVDTKQPLEWTHHQGVYRLAFHLKATRRGP